MEAVPRVLWKMVGKDDGKPARTILAG
jgi:hypothetical protein